MARPKSTEQEIGASACAPFARIVMREAPGSLRYRSFSGFCSDRRSMATSLVIFDDSPRPTQPQQSV
jgi:hypothetical protein